MPVHFAHQIQNDQASFIEESRKRHLHSSSIGDLKRQEGKKRPNKNQREGVGIEFWLKKLDQNQKIDVFY